MNNVYTIQTKDLSKFYGKGENLVKALDMVNIQIKHGEFVAVVGKSGSGKSTLLHMLGGLDSPTSGSVWVGDKEISCLSENEMSVFRKRQVGFIFQSYNLIASLNVWENIGLPLGLDDRVPDEEFINSLLKTLDIKDKIHALPNMLSGGQQQRVAIARAIASKPALLLADEPTGNLDSKTSSEVMTLLKLTAKKYGQTLLVITHDEDIAQTADRIILLEDGMVVGQ